MVTLTSLGKTVTIGASISGVWVGVNMMCHGGYAELPLAMSVALGSLGALITGHGGHDAAHVVVHRSIDKH